MTDPHRGRQARLTEHEQRELLRSMKDRALTEQDAGAVTAVAALMVADTLERLARRTTREEVDLGGLC